MPRYQYTPFPYETPPELRGDPGRRWPVIIVGAGPIGLAAAIDLALHGIACLVLDDNDRVSIGSRAIVWSKRTLEIFDRLGVGERMRDKGVTWKVGRLFHRDREIFSFDSLPEGGHKMPAFINLQQYYVEQYLVERCRDFPDLIDLRWKNRVTQVGQDESGVTVAIETPDGPYDAAGDYLLACDGAKSGIRAQLGLEFKGQVFEERFLIADVEMKTDMPSERWFWFEPPFHSGQSALLHKQPDDIYRIDLQLGWETDPEEEKKPENVIPRIDAVVNGRPFELDWVSVYTFQCARLERFVHDRILFLGDSAHVVSPFGARGGNGGIQDVDNLVWKLAAVIEGRAGPALLETYNAERVHGADENIKNSARSTSFMTPKTDMEFLFRNTVLDLAAEMPFAQRLVNSGRLSRPCSLAGFALQTPASARDDVLSPGIPCPDAPLRNSDGGETWLLEQVGHGFRLLNVGVPALEAAPVEVEQVTIAPPDATASGAFTDAEGLTAERYGAGCRYLIRPDQHIAARFDDVGPAAVTDALNRAMGGQL